MPRATAAMGIVVAAMTAALVVGCGGDDVDPKLEPLQRAIEQTSATGSRFVVRASVGEGADTIKIRGYGQTEKGDVRQRAVIRLSGLGRVETIIDGPQNYIGLKGALGELLGDLQELPKGTKWLKFDERKVYDAAGLGSLSGVAAQSPAQQVKLLARLDPDVTNAGNERVRGVQTTRYRVSVPFGRFYAETVGKTKGAPKLPTKARNEKVRFVFWVGSDDRIRRTRLRVTSEGEGVVATIEVTGFDEDVKVKVPSGPSVYDATDEFVKSAQDERI